MQTQFDGRYPQHGRAFLTTSFIAGVFEGGRVFRYSLCFILLYRRRTCFGSILRNLSCLFPVEFFAAWLSRFLFVCCSVAGGIKVTSRNFFERLSTSTLCSNALVCQRVAGMKGGKLKWCSFFLSHNCQTMLKRNTYRRMSFSTTDLEWSSWGSAKPVFHRGGGSYEN